MVDLHTSIGALVVTLDGSGTIFEDGGQGGRVGYVCSIAICSDDHFFLRSRFDFHVNGRGV